MTLALRLKRLADFSIFCFPEDVLLLQSDVYKRQGWNRDKVYQYLGFDSEYFRDTGDFPDATLLRGWVDDESAFDLSLIHI